MIGIQIAGALVHELLDNAEYSRLSVLIFDKLLDLQVTRCIEEAE